MGLGINYAIMANHIFSLITISTTDPRLLLYLFWRVTKRKIFFLKYYIIFILLYIGQRYQKI